MIEKGGEPMGKFYRDEKQAMWGWLAGEIDKLPTHYNDRKLKILASFGGGVDPYTIEPVNGMEASMLRFAKRLDDMRRELEELRRLNA